jgi:hypothetical protein
VEKDKQKRDGATKQKNKKSQKMKGKERNK